MNTFEDELHQRLAALREAGLLRGLRRVDSPQSTRLEIDGRQLLNFSSNDYLGLANEPALKEAAIKAVETFGAGSGASRLICGSLAPHHELEETLAQFKGAEAALTFATGYATALGVICALLGREDVIALDKLVHASMVDAARLSGAKLRVFAHNDADDLGRILKWAQPRRTLIVTESVFSMDGDFAPLREIVEAKNQYGGWLMVDEAHATGLYGSKGRGLAEECGVADQIEIQMGTLGKAIGASGGYVCGSRALVDYLVNRARSLIFSTAPVPAAAAAATAGIQFVQSAAGEERRNLLWKRVDVAKSWMERGLQAASASPGQSDGKARAPLASFTLKRPEGRAPVSPIIPLMVGDETKAVETAAALRAQGIFVPAIRYPTVARGAARLRVTLTAAHSEEDVVELAAALQSLPVPLKLPG